MPLSELEALAAKTDYSIRAELIKLLDYKEKLKERLDSPDITVLEEERVNGIIRSVDTLITQVKHSGTF